LASPFKYFGVKRSLLSVHLQERSSSQSVFVEVVLLVACPFQINVRLPLEILLVLTPVGASCLGACSS
jgi:hypothetical protein